MPYAPSGSNRKKDKKEHYIYCVSNGILYFAKVEAAILTET
jgi:F0F1-type ATP synthase epsilon subunit